MSSEKYLSIAFNQILSEGLSSDQRHLRIFFPSGPNWLGNFSFDPELFNKCSGK